MTAINDAKTVREQYATEQRLNIRISVQGRYSVNKQGFGNWIFSQYSVEPNADILELGCGNGHMWLENYARLPQGCHMVLSDFSSGMVKAARDMLRAHAGIDYRQIDIQAIPFEDSCMDIVIANMMLYHVPDIDRGLSEVARVLRPGGKLYCATYGENGIAEYLAGLFAEYGVKIADNHNFTLQSGSEILSRHFSHVEKLNYVDALEVTDVGDLISYARSLGEMLDFSSVPDDAMRRVFAAKMVDGILRIPKEYGMFISQK